MKIKQKITDAVGNAHRQSDVDREMSECSQEQLSKLAAAAPGVIHAYRLRPDGTACFPYANQSIENIYGLKPEELVHDATPALNRIHPEDIPRLMTSVERSASAMSLWREEFRVNHPQKGLIWVEGCSSPMREPDGGILWHGFLLDITDRKRVETELRQTVSLLQSTLESTADGILVVDASGKIISFNKHFATLWRIPQNVLDTRDDKAALKHVLGQVKFPDAFLRKVQELYADVEAESFDALEFKDGRVFERYSRPQLLDGKPIGRVWSFRDVTANKLLEAEVLQVQKMEAFGQLAAGVAHDFNNILTVIQGNLALLQTEQLSKAEQSSALAEALNAAGRAAGLTRQLLTFGRRQPIQLKPLDLNDVVATTTKMLQRLIGEQIAMEARYTSGGAPVQADRNMLEQILVNLAINSRDAMPKGGKLTLETAAVDFDGQTARSNSQRRPGGFIRISVGDTGTGIAPEHRSHIFEPFFTTKEVGKGTGLGLATVFGIVERHHGWIEMESRQNVGTTFHIYLPRLAKNATPRIQDSIPKQVRGGNETILLVEDETPVRELMQMLLARRGYKIYTAANGNAALRIWNEHRNEIKLLITDMVMPEDINGRELADRMLQDRKDLKVIYCSGYTDDVLGSDSPLRDNVNFLEKPFEPGKFLQRVRDYLDDR